MWATKWFILDALTVVRAVPWPGRLVRVVRTPGQRRALYLASCLNLVGTAARFKSLTQLLSCYALKLNQAAFSPKDKDSVPRVPGPECEIYPTWAQVMAITRG